MWKSVISARENYSHGCIRQQFVRQNLAHMTKLAVLPLSTGVSVIQSDDLFEGYNNMMVVPLAQCTDSTSKDKTLCAPGEICACGKRGARPIRISFPRKEIEGMKDLHVE